MLHFWRHHKLALGILALVLILIGTGVWAWLNFNETYKDGQIIDVLNRAETAQDEGNYPLAFQLFQEAQSLDPLNANKYSQRQGDIAFLNGDYKIAVTLYKQSGLNVSAELDYYPVLEEITNLNIESANQRLDKLIPLIQPDRPLKLEKITQLKEKLAAITAENSPTLKKALVGKLLIEEDTYELAHQVISSLIEDEPEYRDAYYLLGVNYLKQGKLDDAQIALNKSLEIDPTFKPSQELIDQIKD
jgi:tetratricopeptide (TPR) repeat protein